MNHSQSPDRTPAPAWGDEDVPSALDVPPIGYGWAASDDIPSVFDALEEEEEADQ